jgi:hypothetical protein
LSGVKASAQTIALDVGLATQAFAQVTFYESEHFRGRTFASRVQVNNFHRSGFNDRASSVIVTQGRWQACKDIRFGGRCLVLRQGSYDSLSGMGMNDRISSARLVGKSCQYDNLMPDPIAVPAYEYRRRPNERVFNAPFTLVRAVVGPPNERCWLEQERVVESGNGDRNSRRRNRGGRHWLQFWPYQWLSPGAPGSQMRNRRQHGSRLSGCGLLFQGVLSTISK